MRARWLLLLLTGLVVAGPARAGVFDDEEARKKILEIERETQSRDQAIGARIDKLESSVKNLGLVELLSQMEALKTELAKLRGEMEVLNNQIETTQKRQRDFYLDLDTRLKRLEQPAPALGGAGAVPGGGGVSAVPAATTPAPQSASAPAPAAVDPKQAAKQAAAEKKAYDAAYALFKKGDYEKAINAFQAFLTEHPGSTLAPNARYWVGMSYFNQRDFKNAMSVQQGILSQYPDSPKVADAMLAIASIQFEQGDAGSARNTLEDIIAKYPNSEAAGKARQRLTAGRR